MWKNYVNFTDRTNKRGFWMAFLFNIIAIIILAILMQISSIFVAVYGLYALAMFLPYLAITVRRLRDAGKHWANIFWCFLPIAGAIILIVILCKPSLPDNGIRVV